MKGYFMNKRLQILTMFLIIPASAYSMFGLFNNQNRIAPASALLEERIESAFREFRGAHNSYIKAKRQKDEAKWNLRISYNEDITITNTYLAENKSLVLLVQAIIALDPTNIRGVPGTIERRLMNSDRSPILRADGSDIWVDYRDYAQELVARRARA